MKNILLLLLLSGPALAQEVPQPFKGANTIIIYTPDSTRKAFAAATRLLLANGYGLDKTSLEAGYLSTPAKSSGDDTFVSLRAVLTPQAGGTSIALRGEFSWVSATTLMAGVDKRQMPVQCVGRGSSPAQRTWEQMQRVAAAYPGGRLVYERRP